MKRAERDGRLVLAATLVLLLAVVIVSYRTIVSLREATAQVEHTHVVVEKLSALAVAINEAESARAELVLSRGAIGEETFARARRDGDEALAELRTLTSDNAAAQAALARLTDLITHKRALIVRSAELVRERPDDVAAQEQIAMEGAKARDAIREIIDGMIREEEELLASRSGREAATSATLQVLIAASIFAVLLALAGDFALRRELARRHRAEEERRRVFDMAAEMMSIGSLDGAREVNPAWERTLGYTAAELRAIPLLDLIHHDDRAGAEQLQRRVRGGERVVGYENRFRTKDGRYCWLQWSVVPDLVNGVIYSAARDVTEQKEHAQRLEALTQELERSNRELQEFASVASHDLQEPLRKIRTFGDRLKQRSAASLDEQARDYLERMQSAAARMQRLIEDLLSFSRIAGRPPQPEPIHLDKIAHEVVADLEGRMAETGGKIEIDALPSIEADPTQMRQLLQNLIGNALKFHKPNEPPQVKVSGSIKSASPASCEIVVTDRGIGFDEKYLDRIFAVFQRLHGRSEYEGTGMGLAICRRIVERHGGSITARSKPGEGATFIVTLPVEQPPSPSQAAVRIAREQPSDAPPESART
jgi:PAS domain S-box-containing protein